jgi:hypothetical protein
VTPTSRLYIGGNGNVGIGTTSPAGKLHIQDTGSGAFTGLRIGKGGDTIGDIAAMVFQTSSNQAGEFGAKIGAIRQGTNARSDMFFSVTDGTGNLNERLRITNDGNVGIGTTNPTAKLSVNGTVRAKEVIVETNWSDYVFAPEYTLAPLSEVEAHIKAHQHLPGIPSAREVAEHGISLGEMQAKLLAKIEELTLHVINQEKRMRHLQRENQQLHAKMKAILPQ